MPYIRHIQNEHHYSEVVERMKTAKKSLRIGTADIKDLYVSENGIVVPLMKVWSDLIKKGVDVQLIHAKEPGKNFKDDFDKYPILWSKLNRMLCPRVHFKIVIIDDQIAYSGSANLTGAGIGMKSKNRRNFESGFLTNHPQIVKSLITQFQNVWNKSHCRTCERKTFCQDCGI